MTSKPESPPPAAKPLSLRRWSQRKHEAARADAESDAVKREDATAAALGGVKRDDAKPAVPGVASSAPTLGAVGAMSPAASVELPPVESLTPDSDFAAFFDAKARVGEAVKRAALKQLLRDPRFNNMDGLDTYVDDYTREDPIPESVLKRLVQSRAFRDPNPEEQAEEQAQRDASIAQAQDGGAGGLPQIASARALPDQTTPASLPAAEAPPDSPRDSPPPKKP